MDQSGLTLFKKGASSCDVAQYYDPDSSTTASAVLNAQGGRDITTANFDFLGMNRVSQTTINGTKYKDNVYMGVDAYFRETAIMNIEFNVIDICDSSISYEFDGVIGLSPRQLVASDPGNLGTDIGFMDQLQAMKKITHQVVSLYIRNQAQGDNISVAKFGSWDQSAILPNAPQYWLRAYQPSTWGIQADSFKMTYDESEIIGNGVNRYIEFKPSLPFLYIPDEDWQNFAIAFAKIHPNDAVCVKTTSSEPAHCKFDYSCSTIPENLHQGLEFRMFDIAGTMTFLVDFQDMLVPWTFFGGDDSQCYIGVFKSNANQNQKTWFLGSAFMDKYYTILDNTMYTSTSSPQIGFGLKDENIAIFQNQYDNSPSNTNFDWEAGDQSYSTLSAGGLVKPVTISPPPNDKVPDVISLNTGTNTVPDAIYIPKKGSATDPDEGDSTFQKYKTEIFGVTAFLVLALIITIVACYCKKKNEYGGNHNIFSDEHISLGKKYIN